MKRKLISGFKIRNSIDADFPGIQGWQCPGCKKCYSPMVKECPNCGDGKSLRERIRPDPIIPFGRKPRLVKKYDDVNKEMREAQEPTL